MKGKADPRMSEDEARRCVKDGWEKTVKAYKDLPAKKRASNITSLGICVCLAVAMLPAVGIGDHMGIMPLSVTGLLVSLLWISRLRMFRSLAKSGSELRDGIEKSLAGAGSDLDVAALEDCRRIRFGAFDRYAPKIMAAVFAAALVFDVLRGAGFLEGI